VSAVAEAAPATLTRRTPRLSVALQIARVEGLRLVRHPFGLIGVLLGAALMVVGTWTVVPVLNRHDGVTVDALMPLAAAMLIVSHLSVSRSVRHGTTELYGSTPARIDATTVGHLLALAWAFGFAVFVALAELIYMKAVGGVGTPRPLVVLTGPALVVLGGAIGVALGRFVRQPFAGPLALIGLVALSAGMLNAGSLQPRAVAESLSPYLPGDHWGEGIGELSLRPLGLHLAYVSSLAVTASLIAVVRVGRRASVIALLCAALASTAMFGRWRADTPSRAEEMAVAAPFLEPDKHRTCQSRSGIRYCAYPAYVPWIEKWSAVVGSVVAAAPAAERPEDLAFMQLPKDNEFQGSSAYVAAGTFQRLLRRGLLGGPQEIHPGLAWGRHSAEGGFELGLALKVAERVTGIDAIFRVTEEDLATMPPRARKMIGTGRFDNCVAFGQGRSIVAMWLAAQATPRARATFLQGYGSLGQVQLNDHQYEVFGYAAPGIVAWGTREAEYAQQLLARDAAEVELVMEANWHRLTNPHTTSDQAAAILGLDCLEPEGSIDRLALNYGSPPCR